MNYKTSLILQVDHNFDHIQAILQWLKESHEINLDSDSIKNKANITLLNQEKESIKIATIRDLKEKLSFSSYHAQETRFFIFLHAGLTTIPAQNALLKSVEEPPENTQLIFVTNTPEKLLETIRSRCKIVSITDEKMESKESSSNSETKQLYWELVNSTHSEKIEIASKYKDRTAALNLCKSLVVFLHKELQYKNTNLTLKQITTNTNRILETITQLEHNTNVLLTLENCFFELN